ncbi:atp-dependent (s)-nad(p)h-hydrate dehydratase family member [Holotrichia oblita]|uniref:Atp-dependent (S)-nad(P)h-hydrate dehydratase family member n=1 Tax=Holotrichia oblita TaxID=644536 RepID=A0ACB9T6S7_HOLOL|nr:atp-dependent (s)-nad(p)h-hydrate dehydratase family member [Holotrichia oblita]
MKSRQVFVSVVCFGCIFLLQYVSAQTNSSTSYCYRFTWLGPEYDNTSTLLNTTCSEYLDDIRAVGVPCRTPFVMTYDGTPPDLDYLYENYRDQVTCRRTRSQVCAKFTYSFNNEIQNATYMCTQAYTADRGYETSGCFKQRVDAHDIEVCLCESVAGARPCNGATSLQISLLLFVILGCLKLILIGN